MRASSHDRPIIMKTCIERMRMAFTVYSSRNTFMNYPVIALITVIPAPLKDAETASARRGIR